MTTIRLAAGLMLLLLSSPSIAGRTPQARNAGFVAAGTASIAGRILAGAPDGQPLSRAKITLRSSALGLDLVGFTDAEGRFAFTGLPAGHYTLSASRRPYLELAYGQKMPGRGSGLPIALRDGQAIADVSWSLPAGAVVTGRVSDASGAPMRNVPVVLMAYRLINGERMLRVADGVVIPTTDHAGAYRVYGILPGDYLVAALPPGDYRFIGDGPWAAGGLEARVVTDEEIAWAEAQLATNRIAAPGGSGVRTSEPSPGPTMDYGRVYFPGAIEAADAQTITLGLGEVRVGIDLTMSLQPTARFEARVAGPDGQPVTDAQVVFTSGGGTMGMRGGGVSRPNLLPGRYTMTARSADGTMRASQSFDINGQDVTGVVLTLQPSPTIAGRLVFDAAGELAPVDPAAVRLSVRPAPPQFRGAPAGADGRFEPHADPGRYRLTVTLPEAARRAGWTLGFAMVDGRDISDIPFELAPGGSLDDVVVTLTDRVTELSGRLLDAEGRAAPGYHVVAFATDEAFWEPGSRRLPPPAVAATDGAYRFVGLPAGRYYLAALTSVDQVDLSDPAMLRELASAATTVTLTAGERRVQDLRFAAR
jgi:hypothetical protein